MLKMESATQRLFDGRVPEVYVWQGPAKRRVEGYMKLLPFIKWGGYVHKPGKFRNVFDLERQPATDKGFNYAMGMNREIESGKPMDEIWPDLEANWNYKIRITDRELVASEKLPKPYGVAFFITRTFYGNWATARDIRDLIRETEATLQMPIYMVGREWDTAEVAKIGAGKDYTGQTNDFRDFLGICRGASFFLGYPAGNGMVAQHIGTPTLMPWAKFKRGMWTNWVEPRRVDKTYKAVNAKMMGSKEVRKIWIDWLSSAARVT